MSHYANYLKERQGKEYVEDEYGFYVYYFHEDFLFIEDLYVSPEHRHKGVAQRYSKELARITLESGRYKMVCNIIPSTNGASYMAGNLIENGFKLDSSGDDIIYFIKEIEHG